MKIKYHSLSDKGKVREINEDYYGYLMQNGISSFIVCDGMGGHNAGEIASKLAVESIINTIKENINGIVSPVKLLENSIHNANFEVLSYSLKEERFNGMGTTCVILLIQENRAFLANVGDSRIYMIRENNIKQISKDQSLVQKLIDENIINEEEAINHPRKNEILEAIGIREKIHPILNNGFDISKGDIFLLCTDGLTEYADEEFILETVINNSIEAASKKLIEFANRGGGKDNITVQIIEIY